MRTDDLQALDVLRCELRLRALDAANLPPFLGSTLRGAFGHALKNAVCIMPHRNCERCDVADRCLYPYLFETPPPPGLDQMKGQTQAPRPFILTPPVGESSNGRHRVERGEELKFGLTVVGRAVSALPYLIYSVSVMARGGLGVERARFDLGEVLLLDKAEETRTIYSSESRRISLPEDAPSTLGALVRSRLEQLGRPPGSAAILAAPPEPSPSSTATGSPFPEIAAPGSAAILAASPEPSPSSTAADSSSPDIAAPGSAAILAASPEPSPSSPATDSPSGQPERPAFSPVSSAEDGSHCRLRDASCDFVEELSSRVCLHFRTPTRIRIEGDLQDSMNFELLVRNLLRRVSLLIAVHGSAPIELDYRGLIARAATVRTRSSNLRWCDWERYSNRQQTKMALGGFVGQVEYEGEAISEFLPLLAAGEILHVGTGTTFGLGEYLIES